MADRRTYIRVHDGLDEHAKIEALSDAGFRLLVSSWCYCSRNLNDGLIAAAAWKRRGTARGRRELEVDLVHGPGHDCPDCPEVPAGFFYMHDYLKHQRSAAEVAEMRKAKAEAGSKGGRTRAQRQARAQAPAKASAQAPATAEPKQTRSENQASTETTTEPSLRSGSEPKGSGRERPPLHSVPDPDGDDASAQQLVAWWVDRHTRRPPSTVVGQVAKHIGALLAEGFDTEQVRRGLLELARKGLHPSTLPSLVNQLANTDPHRTEVEAARRHNAETPWDPVPVPGEAEPWL